VSIPVPVGVEGLPLEIAEVFRYICRNVQAETVAVQQTGQRFVDRGDPAAVDFDETDLTMDNTWRDLDLSSLVCA